MIMSLQKLNKILIFFTFFLIIFLIFLIIFCNDIFSNNNLFKLFISNILTTILGDKI